MHKNVLISNSRRAEIKNVVLAVLKLSKINDLPVTLQKILNFHGWAVTDFKTAESFGIYTPSKSGFTLCKGSRKMIIYNDAHLRPRRRWTISHEIGHISLDHLDESTKIDDNVAEAEANYFARELLMPLAVLDKLRAYTPTTIARTCDVSIEAAELRAADFPRRFRFKTMYGDTTHDKAFLRQFHMNFEGELCVA